MCLVCVQHVCLRLVRVLFVSRVRVCYASSSPVFCVHDTCHTHRATTGNPRFSSGSGVGGVEMENVEPIATGIGLGVRGHHFIESWKRLRAPDGRIYPSTTRRDPVGAFGMRRMRRRLSVHCQMEPPNMLALLGRHLTTFVGTPCSSCLRASICPDLGIPLRTRLVTSTELANLSMLRARAACSW